MKLVVVSHKECWADENSPTGYVTVGGFPLQMRALAGLFDATMVVQLQREGQPPSGALPIDGERLSVCALPEPRGAGWGRKLAIWRRLPAVWREVKCGDAVHALVPGDLGSIGLLAALIQGKPLFVRHCGTWGTRDTLAQRLLSGLLPRIAGDRAVVMATGLANAPPEAGNWAIEWIFSTSLSEADLEAIRLAVPWPAGEPLRLISVGRLVKGKNMQTIIEALPILHTRYPAARLDILGEGDYRPSLERLIDELGLADYVTLHGNRSHQDVLVKLSEAHLFVFPTQTKEGFPKAVLEALAAGLPVIASGVSALPSLLRQGCGVVMPEPTAPAVAEAIGGLLEDTSQMRQMAESARRVSRDYTLERWADIIGERLHQQWGPLRNAGDGSNV